MHFKKRFINLKRLVVLTIDKAYMKIADDIVISNTDPEMKPLEHPDLDVGTLTGTPAKVTVYLSCGDAILVLHRQVDRVSLFCQHTEVSRRGVLLETEDYRQ